MKQKDLLLLGVAAAAFLYFRNKRNQQQKPTKNGPVDVTDKSNTVTLTDAPRPSFAPVVPPEVDIVPEMKF